MDCLIFVVLCLNNNRARVVLRAQPARGNSRARTARTTGAAPMTRALTNPDPCSAIEAGRSLRSLTSAMAERFHLPSHTARVGSAARFPAFAWLEVAICINFSVPATFMSLPLPVTSPKMPPSKGTTSLTRVRSPARMFADSGRNCKA